jgi:hypothetical protein
MKKIYFIQTTNNEVIKKTRYVAKHIIYNYLQIVFPSKNNQRGSF